MHPCISVRGSARRSVRPSVTLLFQIRENAWIQLLRKGEGERRGEGRGRGWWGGGDGASTNVPLTPRDASDGRVSGLVLLSLESFSLGLQNVEHWANTHRWQTNSCTRKRRQGCIFKFFFTLKLYSNASRAINCVHSPCCFAVDFYQWYSKFNEKSKSIEEGADVGIQL